MAKYSLDATINADASDFEKGIKKANSSMDEFKNKCQTSSKQVEQSMTSLPGKITPAWEQLGTKASNVWNNFKSSAQQSASAAWNAVKTNTSQIVGSLGGIAASGAAMIGGIAVKGGFDRALAIDNAKKKLAGFGHDAKDIESIMDSATSAVRGTAFGLGDAATAAATLSAAGIKSGNQMTNSLKAAANVAAASGRDFNSVGVIFSSVAARGKLMGDDMLQLTSSGVPVLQLLGDHLGKTSAEVSDMVSKGQIDFQTFSDAMQQGLGDSAQKSGDTFMGSMANVKAALSRFTEPLANGAIQGLVGVFKNAAPAIDNFGKGIQQLSPAFVPAIAAAVAFAGAGLAPMLTQLPIIGGMLGPVTGLLSAMGGPVGIAIAAFIGLVATCKPLQDALGKIGEAVGNMASAVGSFLSPALDTLGKFLEPIVQSIGQGFADALNTAAGFISDMSTKLQDFTNGGNNVMTTLEPFIEILQNRLAPAANAAKDAFDFIKQKFDELAAQAQAVLMPALQQIQPFFDVLAAGLMGGVFPAFSAVANVVGTVFVSAFQIAAGIVSAAMQIIMGVITTVVGIIQTIIGVFVGIFTGNWQMAANGASTILNGMASVITGIMNGVLGAIGGILNAIKNIFASIWNGILSTVQGVLGGMASAVTDKIGAAKNTVSNGLNAISGFFRGLRLEFPKIKLPHFKIEGSFSIAPPSVPHLGIDWYAEGGILTQPTIFGMNGGKLLGGGEAGAEAVAPIAKLQGYVHDAVADLFGNGGEQTINIYIDGIKYNTDEYIDDSVRDFVTGIVRKGSMYA